MTSHAINDPNRNAGLQAAMIAQQNDQFRKAACGIPIGETPPQGKLVMTAGISQEGPAFQMIALETLGSFSDFTPDNDPYGWHDFGEVIVAGKRVWFKIDLFDQAYEMGSEVPHDPEMTRRVLTLLFPQEY